MRKEKGMKTILVVDDDEMNLSIARFILQKENYQVKTAYSGMECLEMLKEEWIDLVLLDVEMPIMNGIKTLEIIREKPEYAGLPVVFLTADATEDTVIAAGKLNATGYVKKPYEPKVLLERVGKILQ